MRYVSRYLPLNLYHCTLNACLIQTKPNRIALFLHHITPNIPVSESTKIFQAKIDVRKMKSASKLPEQ